MSEVANFKAQTVPGTLRPIKFTKVLLQNLVKSRSSFLLSLYCILASTSCTFFVFSDYSEATHEHTVHLSSVQLEVTQYSLFHHFIQVFYCTI